MEIVLKDRDAGYCNLKLLLMTMVVYGHLIEPMIYDNKILYEIYRIVYLVHMPMFTFLSGLFLRNIRSCLAQAGKAIIYYIVFQSIYLVFDFCVNQRIGSIITPYWHLWYLLSLALWSLIGALYYLMEDRLKWKWQIKMIVVIVAIATGCFAGGIKEIDYRLSLSRTLVFLPYFLAGVLCKMETGWNRYCKIGAGVLIVSMILYVIIRGRLPVEFLWQSQGYGVLEFENGCVLRIICYILGGGISFFLLTNMTKKRFFFTKIGSDTMFIYVMHIPAVMFFHKILSLDWRHIIAAPLEAVLIMLLLYKIFQWNSQIFIIRGKTWKETCGDGSV